MAPELRGQSKEAVRAAIEREWNLRVGTGRINPWYPATFWMRGYPAERGYEGEGESETGDGDSFRFQKGQVNCFALG